MRNFYEEIDNYFNFEPEEEISIHELEGLEARFYNKKPVRAIREFKRFEMDSYGVLDDEEEENYE